VFKKTDKQLNMTKNIHPSIRKLNISEKAKVYFNKLEFYEIIEDPIVLSTKDNRINEYSENRWSFRVDYNFKLCTKKDLTTNLCFNISAFCL
jgi:hypothetical protein